VIKITLKSTNSQAGVFAGDHSSDGEFNDWMAAAES
jgi:hypothetical protein